MSELAPLFYFLALIILVSVLGELWRVSKAWRAQMSQSLRTALIVNTVLFIFLTTLGLPIYFMCKYPPTTQPATRPAETSPIVKYWVHQNILTPRRR